jgi:putative Mg2+ transporter-C (MgtC) family protein
MDLWQGVIEDFSDLPRMGQVIQLFVRLLLATVLGGVLGFERERAGKAAGMRTHMLVSLGAALFIAIPQQSGMSAADLSRVIQGLVTGIGFIGAGSILKHQEQQQVQGLTTAAGLWLTAAVGIAAGIGREASAVLGTLMALFILTGLARVGQWINRDRV